MHMCLTTWCKFVTRSASSSKRPEGRVLEIYYTAKFVVSSSGYRRSLSPPQYRPAKRPTDSPVRRAPMRATLLPATPSAAENRVRRRRECPSPPARRLAIGTASQSGRRLDSPRRSDAESTICGRAWQSASEDAAQRVVPPSPPPLTPTTASARTRSCPARSPSKASSPCTTASGSTTSSCGCAETRVRFCWARPRRAFADYVVGKPVLADAVVEATKAPDGRRGHFCARARRATPSRIGLRRPAGPAGARGGRRLHLAARGRLGHGRLVGHARVPARAAPSSCARPCSACAPTRASATCRCSSCA